MLYMEVITLYSWEQCETYKQTVLVKCSFIVLQQLTRINAEDAEIKEFAMSGHIVQKLFNKNVT